MINHYPRLFILILLLCYNPVISQVSFQEISGTPFPGVVYSHAEFADVNNDSFLDLILTGLNDIDKTASLFLNDGTGNYYEEPNAGLSPVYYSSLDFADVDNDNDKDVVIMGYDQFSQKTCKLYINDGNGLFTVQSNTPFHGAIYGSVDFGDVNNDNLPDILITGLDNSLEPNTTRIYMNNGAGNFSELLSVPFQSVLFGEGKLADVDNDGDKDVVIAGRDTAYVGICEVYKNNGTGSFSWYAPGSIQGIMRGEIDIVKLNSDGNRDLFIYGEQNSGPNAVAKTLLNTGTGYFSLYSSGILPMRLGSSDVADVDNDGDVDVLLTGFTNSGGITKYIKLFLNDGSGNFTELTGLPFDAIITGTVNFADIDNDGDKDVLITGENQNGIRIAKLYRNNLIVGVEELKNNITMNISPNPANNGFNVSFSEGFKERVEIVVIDLLGKQIFSTEIQAGISQISISSDTFSAGNYIVSIKGDSILLQNKLTIK